MPNTEEIDRRNTFGFEEQEELEGVRDAVYSEGTHLLSMTCQRGP